MCYRLPEESARGSRFGFDKDVKAQWRIAFSSSPGISLWGGSISWCGNEMQFYCSWGLLSTTSVPLPIMLPQARVISTSYCSVQSRYYAMTVR
jgi:hypothetical protein